MLKVSDLSKSYLSDSQNIDVLKGVSFTLETGSSLSIQGASGCGKSTLLHLIGALDKVDDGTMRLSTEQLCDIKIESLSETQADLYRRKHIGFVFQKYNLIDCISVRDNILLPSQLNHMSASNYIDELAETLGIAEHLQKLPTQLSGGQQQRAAIARALAHRPQLILADEPTGNLDEDNSDIVSDLLYRSCETLGTSLIVVTHSNKVAAQANIQMRMQHKQLVA